MPTEASVNVPNTGTRPVRTNQVTETIGGTPTVVDQQVITVADSTGTVFESLFDRQQRLLMEMDSVRASDVSFNFFARRSTERSALTDRRGSTGRGSTR